MKHTLRFLLYLLTALLLTSPLPGHALSHIPRGAESSTTVPLFNLWSLQWNIDQLLHGYPHYWNAPIFAPTPGTFAFSEPQLLSGLLAAPLWTATQSPALGYNSLLWLFLTLNGWFASYILRFWGLSWPAALGGGLLMQALPFVAQEMGVLQLTALFGFLGALLFLLMLYRHARWRDGLALAVALSATWLTCGYYGLFSLIFLPLAALFFMGQAQRAMVGPLLLAGLLTLLLCGPLLLSQRQQLAAHNFSRRPETIRQNSARLSDYRKFLDYNLLYGQLLTRQSERGQRLFPGIGLLILAAIGMVGRGRWRCKLYLLTALGLAVLLSLGLRWQVIGVQPYELLRHYLPGFAQLRSPFRFAAFAQLHLALLAAFGLQNFAWLGRRLFARHGAKLFPLIITLLLLSEMMALPLPLQPVPSPVETAWSRWLHRHNPTTVVMLPFAPTNHVGDFAQTVRWMLLQRQFAARIVNGYSGFFPADYFALRRELLADPTSPTSLSMLRAHGVHYLVIDHRLPHAPPAEAIAPQFPPLFTDEVAAVSIYGVP